MTDPLASIRAARDRDGDLTLAITGEIDVSNAEAVQRECVKHMEDARRTTLDLGDVRYIDSAGLRVVVALWQHAHAAGGTLHVAAPGDGFVAELLAITGLGEQLLGPERAG